MSGCCNATLAQLVVDLRKQHAQWNGNPDVQRGLKMAEHVVKASVNSKASTSAVQTSK